MAAYVQVKCGRAWSAIFLALGAPLTLLREVLPGSARQRASRILHSTPARMLTFPLVMTAALIAPLYLVYLTSLYEASLRSAAVSAAVTRVW